MNLVRELRSSSGVGVTEVSWDGTDSDGVRVSNGVYFYTIETGGDNVWGKILLIE